DELSQLRCHLVILSSCQVEKAFRENMRFVSFNYIDRFPCAGVLLGASVIDLSAAAALVYEGMEGQRWELLDILRGAPEGMGLEGAIDIAGTVLDQLGFDDADAFGASADDDGTDVPSLA